MNNGTRILLATFFVTSCCLVTQSFSMDADSAQTQEWTLGSVNARVRAVESTMEVNLADLQRRVDSAMAGLQKIVEDRAVSSRKRDNEIDVRVQAVESTTRDNLADLQGQVSCAIARLRKVVQGQAAHLRRRDDEIDAHFQTVESTMRTSLARFQERVDSAIAGLQKTVEDQAVSAQKRGDEVDVRVQKVESAMGTSLARLQERVDSVIAGLQKTVEDQVTSAQKRDELIDSLSKTVNSLVIESEKNVATISAITASLQASGAALGCAVAQGKRVPELFDTIIEHAAAMEARLAIVEKRLESVALCPHK